MEGKNLIYMLSGQGSQYYQMGKDLYDSNEVFRGKINFFSDLIADISGTPLLSYIYDPQRNLLQSFDDSYRSGLSIFLVEMSIIEMLACYDVHPDKLMGSSLGFVIALVAAKCIGVEQAVKLLMEHGEIFRDKCRPGVMIAVLDSVDTYYKTEELVSFSDLAGINFDRSFVVSLPGENTKIIEQCLTRSGLSFQRMAVSRPYHSKWIDPLEVELKKIYGKVEFKPPIVPVYCASECGKVEVINEVSIWNAVRGSMDFFNLGRMMEASFDGVYVDVGASGTLANFMKYLAKDKECLISTPIVSPFRNSQANLDRLLTICGLG